MGKSNTFQKVYEVVQGISEGRVATYGQVSSMINEKWPMLNGRNRITPNVVGFALHANRDAKIPCHRVVNKIGRLAPNFAFDGWREQKRRLQNEGVKFRDETHVDLVSHLWQP